jgi:biotin carboxyl carrier protein
MKLKITVHGVAYEVDVQVLDAKDEMTPAPGSPLPPAPATAPAAAASPPPATAPAPAAAPDIPGGGVASPIAGTVLEVKCQAGAAVDQGQTLLVIEAMKMETAIAAPSAGKVKSVLVAAGDSVRENQILVELE